MSVITPWVKPRTSIVDGYKAAGLPSGLPPLVSLLLGIVMGFVLEKNWVTVPRTVWTGAGSGDDDGPSEGGGRVALGFPCDLCLCLAAPSICPTSPSAPASVAPMRARRVPGAAGTSISDSLRPLFKTRILSS